MTINALSVRAVYLVMPGAIHATLRLIGIAE